MDKGIGIVACIRLASSIVAWIQLARSMKQVEALEHGMDVDGHVIDFCLRLIVPGILRRGTDELRRQGFDWLQ